jgi:glycine/D-amino acid oxidase-like deaminating enzyme
VVHAAASHRHAGGFLALDWCDSTALGPLARKSFQLHAELADELGGTGYRRMASHSVSVRAGAGASTSGRRGGKAALPGWVDGPGVAQSSAIGSPETTAQVHPELLTRALLRGAEERGGRLVLAAVTGLELDPGGRRVAGVRVRDSGTHEESVLPAGAVVFCMGEGRAPRKEGRKGGRPARPPARPSICRPADQPGMPPGPLAVPDASSATAWCLRCRRVDVQAAAALAANVPGRGRPQGA